MNFKYDQANLQNGRLNAQTAQETPGTFGEVNSADTVASSKDLARSPQRMAGQMGARALAMMEDPEEIQRTNQWMDQFGMSNQGMQWNQAKMTLSQPMPTM